MDERTGVSWRLRHLVTAVPTAILLVLFNLVPLAGVLWWGWQLQTILVLYWLESGVIGVLNVPRLALARGAPDRAAASGPARIGTAAKIFLIPFFIVHYGLFWLVHGVFVLVLPVVAALVSPAGRAETVTGGAPSPLSDVGLGAGLGAGLDWGDVVAGAVAMGLFHLISFVYWDVVRREYEHTSPEAQMFAPYRRVVVLHLTILGGAFLVGLTGQPIAALTILVILKTLLDLRAHVGAHGDGEDAADRGGRKGQSRW